MSERRIVRFGYPMRAWQRECAQLSVGRRFVVMALHRRAGKTELALKKLLDAAVKNPLDLPLYIYVAPLLKQAKSIAWSRLKQMVAALRAAGGVEVNESDAWVRFPHNGALVRLYGADNPDAIRGVRLDGCVIDEVAQVKPEVWEEILMPALSDRKGWCWFIGTPKGINLFSALFFAAENREDWARARYTVYQTDALDPAEVERMRAEMSVPAFAREYLCDFTAAGDDQLISLTDVEMAANRVHAADAFGHAARVLGVDPARFGNDRSVIFPRQGVQAFTPIVLRGVDNMALAGQVAAKIEHWRPDSVFIDSGAGAGVIDRLRQLGHDVIEINFGGKANDPRYDNKRAEMWFDMAEAIRGSLSIPDDNALKLELATPTYKFDAANRIILESKDEIKKRLPDASSPDLADALALTYAYPVMPRSTNTRPVRNTCEYDPYAALR
jgi:hypothetical protein